MNPAKREEIFRRLKQLNPTPRTELEYASPFELLVAVVLSAQATDKSVNRATRELFRTANTPDANLALGEDGLVPYIQRIGLFRTKARNLASPPASACSNSTAARFLGVFATVTGLVFWMKASTGPQAGRC